MAKSDLLRVQDVRSAYRLIGECRDVGCDPALWQARLFAGLSDLFGEVSVTGGEGMLDLVNGTIAPLTYLYVNFTDAELPTFYAYIREGGPARDPFIRALPRKAGSAVTHTRRQLVPDREYYRSPVFDRYFRPGHVGHRLVSIFPTPGGRAVSLLHLHRLANARDFSGRERTVLEFLHNEMGPLVGRALVSAAEPTPGHLSPRLRQTLACLIEGDTEKQVAARLGLSYATVHQYVTAVYRRFGVTSRGQLLAHVLKRAARPEWRDALNR